MLKRNKLKTLTLPNNHKRHEAVLLQGPVFCIFRNDFNKETKHDDLSQLTMAKIFIEWANHFNYQSITLLFNDVTTNYVTFESRF